MFNLTKLTITTFIIFIITILKDNKIICDNVETPTEIDEDTGPTTPPTQDQFVHDTNADRQAIGTFSAEWERRMSDFEPDYVYMIPTRYRTAEVITIIMII